VTPVVASDASTAVVVVAAAAVAAVAVLVLMLAATLSLGDEYLSLQHTQSTLCFICVPVAQC